MRHYLEQLVLRTEGDPFPMRGQLMALEVDTSGEWRILLQGLRPESLVVLQELFGTPHTALAAGQTEEGERLTGQVRVAKLGFGNEPTAVLEGLTPLP